MIKMLVFADIHGDDGALERLEKYKKQEYDYVLNAGDSTNNSTSFIAELLELFPHMYIIPGNNENAPVVEILHKAKYYAHEKRFELKGGYNLVGFGFSNPTPFYTPGELSEDNLYEKLKKLKIDGKTILLLHAPPYGLLDKIKDVHLGSKAVRKIIEETNPFLVLCAHLHEVVGVKKFGKTLIINIPPANKLDICEIEIGSKDIGIEFKKI